MFNNQKKFLLIEYFILFFPMLLLMCVFMRLAILLFNSDQTDSIRLLFVCAFYVLIALSLNILFFSVLKNKLNMEIETFWYGVGFLSSYIAFGSVLSVLMDATVGAWVFYYYSLPLISLFYTYAVVLKNTEKGINNTILFLMMITIVFFGIGIIKDFEILKLRGNYEFFTLMISILFGLYTGYYAVYRTIRMSLRNVAWVPFLMLFILGFGFLLYLELIYVNGLSIHLSVYYFLFSFAVSCLAGIVCKYLKKNQSRIRTRE